MTPEAKKTEAENIAKAIRAALCAKFDVLENADRFAKPLAIEAVIAGVLGPRLAPSKTTRDIVGAFRDRLRTLFASWTDPESENRVPPMELLAGIETQLGFLEAQIEAVLSAGGGGRREG